MQKITPFLCFDGCAEEATRFYTSVFPGSRITNVLRHTSAGPGAEGTVLAIDFELEGEGFIALNGGPTGFSPAISFLVNCETQAEVDRLWARLLDGGEEQQCGWLTDRFGVTWQIVPRMLMPMLRDKDPARAARVMQAMMGMVKLDIAALERAYGG